jgi:hypothetical protein
MVQPIYRKQEKYQQTMKRPTVYHDTTIPSYLFDDGEKLKTLVQITQLWWQEEIRITRIDLDATPRYLVTGYAGAIAREEGIS